MTGKQTSAQAIPMLALLLGGLAVGAFSFAVARSDPAYALVGDSVEGALAELGAGCALIAVGMVSWKRRPDSRFGGLLALAGLAWLLAELNNPEIGSSLGFTIGLVLFAAAPPLVAHAALSYPDGRLRSRIDRLGIGVAYLGAAVVLGLLPALFFDPSAAGCAQCPENLLLVDGSSGRFEDLNQSGVDLGLVWSLGIAALLVLRLVRSTSALRRLIWPVLIAATVYLGLVAADFGHSLDRGFLGNDATDIDLRAAQAGALLALSLGVAWSWVRARNTRAEVARLVVDLARSSGPGGLRDALADTLGDSTIELAYPLEDGTLVDAGGRTVALNGEVTALVRDGREVGLLSHRSGLLDDPGLAEEVAAAARLALENERLRAQAGAQLEDLRASRARVIATGDAERRRLERDLHDGAQQQLVGLALSLRLARSTVQSEPDPARLARMDEADGELRAALAELRQLAHGIFPAVLADEGLGSALEALTEEAGIPVQLSEVPDRRFDAPVEAAAYYVVSETVRRGATGTLKVSAATGDGRLLIELEGDIGTDQPIELEDRVGALDGTLEVIREPGGGARVRAEIPCE
jgi:signal transduction histidine kinase